MQELQSCVLYTYPFFTFTIKKEENKKNIRIPFNKSLFWLSENLRNVERNDGVKRWEIWCLF